MPAVVTHLTSVHRPDDPRISLKECRTLAAQGFDVTLVATGAPSAPQPGVDYVAIRRPRNRLSRMLLGPLRVLQAARRNRSDIYHFHDPELLVIGILLRIGGARVVYDAHEDLPRQIAYKPYLPAITRRPVAAIAGLLESVAARRVDGIVAATPHIARRFPADKTVIVRNYPLIAEFEQNESRPYRERRAEVVYVGRITEAIGAYVMAESARLVGERRHGIEFTFAGDAPDALAAEIVRRAAPIQPIMPGWIGRETVAELLGRARIGLVIFQPEENYIEAYPTKLFEYMAAGLPVVASDFPVWREIVAGAGCGLLVDPTDPAAVATAVEALLDDPARAEEMGSRGRAAVFERFRWEPEGARLVEFYRRLLQQ
jgi:glycosyltransferase involved in cell wall biosynthesis